MTSAGNHLRRSATWLAAAGMVLATVGLLSASSVSFASTAAASRVSGNGVRSASSSGDVPFSFAFEAVTNPAATDGVYGTFSGTFPHDTPFPSPGDFANFQGVITCLRVAGDEATIGGVVTSGYGYDDNYTQGQNDLTGDWFITTVQDNSKQPGGSPPDTMGYIDWGDRAYFATEGFKSLNSVCDNPAADLGTSQFPLSTGDIAITG